MEIFILYKTDNWHSHNSKDLLAVCTTFKKAIAIAKQQAKKEGEKITDEGLYNLQNIRQTQDYEGEGEFVIEEFEKNVLL